jgi:hypothetical protein
MMLKKAVSIGVLRCYKEIALGKLQLNPPSIFIGKIKKFNYGAFN